MVRGKFEIYEMVVDNFNVGLVSLNRDIVQWFEIANLTSAEHKSYGTRKRRAHERSVYASRNTQTTTRTTTVREVFVADVRRKNRRNSGKKIKVPLGLTSTPPIPRVGGNPSARRIATDRYTTINFPLRASNYQIARWINTHFTSHKPVYFLTPAGASYPVDIPDLPQQSAGEEIPAPAA